MTTNVPTVTFGSTGFQGPSTTQILTGVIADIQAAFGGMLNLSINNLASLNTPQGQLATSLTAQIVNANNTFLLQSTQTDPAFAFGQWQDAIGRIYFMQRNPAEPTSLLVACNGAQNVVIPVGAIIQDNAGNLYTCTQQGTIPLAGTINLTFAAQVAGPIAVPNAVTIFKAINQWDSVTFISGTEGKNVETRAEFETRRQDSVAGNSFGAIGSIIGAVAAVPGVLDYFGFNNNTASPLNLNGVVIPAFGIYICVAGGAPSDVAHAILSKKGAGAPMAGNTTVTVFDSNPLYASPIPYQITYQIPSTLQILISVILVSGPFIPSDAEQQIQEALLAAFSGNQLSAAFTGFISGTTLTVTEVESGTILQGQTLSDISGQVIEGTTISANGTGQGGVGTYTVSLSQNVASEPMTSQSVNTNSNIPRARINSQVFAIQYVAAITALGSWAQVASILIGSANTPDAVTVGHIIGNTLTVVNVTSGTILLDDFLFDTTGLIPTGTQITIFSGGSGGSGNYTVNNPLSIGATFTGTGSGTNLTASAVTGIIQPGQIVLGAGVPANTMIVSGPPAGGAGVYVTSNATTSAGAALSANEVITMASANRSNVQVNANQEPQLAASSILTGTT